MFEAAENLQFERATELRDRLRALREEHGDALDAAMSPAKKRSGRKGAASRNQKSDGRPKKTAKAGAGGGRKKRKP